MNNEKKVRKILIENTPGFYGYVAASFVFAVVIQLIGLIPPILMEKVIDKYIPAGDLKSALVSVVLFVLIPTTATLLTTAYNYMINVLGRKMGQSLLTMGFANIVRRPLAFFDKENSGELVSYCKGDSMEYALFWILDMPNLFAKILSGAAVFVFMARINVFIAVMSLLYIPFSLLPAKYFSRKIEGYIKKITENNAKANQLMTDTLKGIKFVKSMLLEEDRISRLREVNASTVKVWGKTVAIDNLNGSWVNDFSDSLFIGLGFSVSAVLIIKGYMTVGMLVLLLNYLPKLFSSVKLIAKTNFNFKKQLGKYERLFELIASDAEKRESGEKTFSMEREISFENVSFAYTAERGNVLNGLTLEIDKGKWVGIVGPSGAGKTTIFDLLLKLYDGYDGKIAVDGTPLEEISTRSLRENVTLVSQEMFLFPGTLRENLAMVQPAASEERLKTVVRDAGLDELISRLPQGLETDIGENGVQLSGGEKQRICLAQGLLRKSPVLLLDEITSNMDEGLEESIRVAIDAVRKKRNVTVVSISHRRKFHESADEIFELKDGKITKKREA